MSQPQADVVFTAVVFVLAVLALLFGNWLIAEPPIPLSSDILAMSPKTFPTLILAGTALAAFIFLARAAHDGTLWKPAASGVNARQSTAIYRQALFVVITVSCALLLTTLGFLTTMFLLMASTSILAGNRSAVQILAISTLLPLGFYVVVTHMLRTDLPEADVIERALVPLLRLLPTV